MATACNRQHANTPKFTYHSKSAVLRPSTAAPCACQSTLWRTLTSLAASAHQQARPKQPLHSKHCKKRRAPACSDAMQSTKTSSTQEQTSVDRRCSHITQPSPRTLNCGTASPTRPAHLPKQTARCAHTKTPPYHTLTSCRRCSCTVRSCSMDTALTAPKHAVLSVCLRAS